MSHRPIPLKDYQSSSRLVRWRIAIGALVIVLLSALLIARQYHLQVIQYDYHSTLAENNRIHVQPIAPSRGLIYDRNGLLLAENRPSFSLTLTRERVGASQQVPPILDSIAELFALSAEEREQLDKRLARGRRPFEAVPILYNLSEEQIALIAVNQFRLPGVEVSAELVRYYPQKEHFAHSIGYVGRINEQELKTINKTNYSGTHHIGKTGIERFYEDELHGEVGYEEVETNARGRVMRVLKRTPPVPGKNLVLTLDSALQQAAEQALGGRRGAVVALDPNSGELLAMVSQPAFDPNPFVSGISFAAYAKLRDSEDHPLFNRILRGRYPPGSTIKPMMAVSGLDAGVITAQSRVFDRGFFQLPGVSHQYRNWNRSGDGWVSLERAIMRSNDTYFYDLANKLGIDRMHRYMSQFGFGQKVALDLFEESTGLMPSREWKRARYNQPWYPGETLIAGIGQGYVQATPLQLAQATALIATKGKWIRPHLAKSIGGRPPQDSNPPADIRLHNPAFWDLARSGMVQVVHAPGGTAQRVGATAAYRIAGKSGTAQVVGIRQGERYQSSKVAERHRDHALFVAFAPAENPQLVVAVMVENGESGSRVAAPVVKEVLDAWLLGDDGQLKAAYRTPPDAPLALQKPVATP